MIRALSYATNITIITITGLTIWAEKVTGVKDALVTLGGHHWVGKGIVAALVYGLSVLVFRTMFRTVRGTVRGGTTEHEARQLYSVSIITLICAVIIFLFFTLEYL